MTTVPPLKVPLDRLIITILAERGLEVLSPGQSPSIEEGPSFWTIRVVPGLGVPVEKVLKSTTHLRLRLRLTGPARIRTQVEGGCVVFEIPKEAKDRWIVDAADLWERREPVSDGLVATFAADMRGDPVSIDFSSSSSPHLLIAGTTGSGKSVALETIVEDLVRQHPPERLRLQLVDPKGTELLPYSKLPHTDNFLTGSWETALMLARIDSVMNRRYREFRDVEVRSLAEFNAKVATFEPEPSASVEVARRWWQRKAPQPVPATTAPMGPLPWILLVIDEYADLATSEEARDIEQSLLRIVQKSRAAGIHVIVATQKPSAKVLSTTIRSNLPAALALRVKTVADSRIILDEPGAEMLAGKGDALLRTAKGTARVQCALLQRPLH